MSENYQCVHRGKTTSCQVVCISDQAAAVCMTNEAYQQTIAQPRNRYEVAAYFEILLIVAIVVIMAIRATLKETRNDR